MRGLKLAVAIEDLKPAYFSQVEACEHVLPPDEFEAKLLGPIREAVREILHDHGVEVGQVNHIASKAKLRALNRRSFGSILRRLCRQLGVPVTHEDLQRFIASRNQLVHEGRFTCQAASPEKSRTAPPTAEYRFLVNFLDRIYLKLLGYSGT